MINKYILMPIVSLVVIIFLFGCGGNSNNENPFSSPKLVRTWNGTWNSSKVTSSGTIFITLTQSETTFSGSMTMTGSPCFSTATITSWAVNGNTINWNSPENGNTINWISPEIGNFIGIISGASIAGTYSVTSTGACFGDTGTFAVTS